MVDTPDLTFEDAFPPGPYMVIGATEDLASALRRMALEQVEVMIAGFDHEADDALLDHKVHLARKAGKRLRGLIRLCREELGPDGYAWANSVVRDQGRRLSEIRTSNVLIGTLDGLVDDSSMTREGMQELRELLAQRHAEMLVALRASSDQRAAAQRALRELSDRIKAFPSPTVYEDRDLAALVATVKASYRKARRAMRKAQRSGSAHAFHEWRKRVNYLRYQLEALSGACAPPMAELVADLDELSETVGEDHDLADLVDISRSGTASVPDGLTTLVERRSRELRDRSLELGSRIFSGRPKEFALLFAASSRSAA